MATDTSRRSFDVIVIGGGHNGLVSACYLARSGLSVLVLERLDRLGGATCSARVFPGVDARLSRYSYLISLLPPKIVEDLGLRLELRRRRILACVPYRRDGEDRALLLSNDDPQRTRDSLTELGGVAAPQEFERFERLQRTLARSVFPSLLEPLRTREQWKSSLRDGEEREAWERFVEAPLGEALEELVSDDLLRGALMTDAKVGAFTDAHDPSLLQNRTFLYHVVGGGTGDWHVPVGGMGRLVDELARVASEAGARTVTGALAERIHPGPRRHTVEASVEGQPMEFDARWVLVNAGPNVLAPMLGREHEPAAEDEGSVVKANMVLKRLPRMRSGLDPEDAFAGTFRINEGYENMRASFREARAGVIPRLPPAEVYCHTLTDPSILGGDARRDGWHTLTLFGLDMPYDLAAKLGPEAGEEVWRRYVSSFDEILDEPFEDCLATDGEGRPCVEVKTAVDLEAEIFLDRGNIFHGAMSWFFTDRAEEAGSWGVETDVPRLYRAGSSAARGGAVSGVPGHNAARRVLADRDAS